MTALLAESEGEHIFVNGDGKPFTSTRASFMTACRKAGLTGVTPHVLRHAFASRLAMAGVDLRTIQELGGWADIKMVERYSHLSPSPGHKVSAIETIATENSISLSRQQAALVS